jgi:long-chain acyl-CoA synthetase
VREYAAPPAVNGAGVVRITDPVVAHAKQHPHAPLFAERDGTQWRDVTAAEFHARVVATAKGLVASGVEVGDRVALLSRTRLEWTVLDYAIWWVGAVSVPLYATSSRDQVAWILRDSGSRHIVVERPRHLEMVDDLTSALEHLSRVWCIEDTPQAADRTLRDLCDAGAEVSDQDLEERRRAVSGPDAATIIYTSGTTGEPKGCLLTHENFLFESQATAAELGELFDAEGAATLLVLPLAHVFARIVQVGAVTRRVRLGHAHDPRRLLDDASTFRPTFLLGVPRVFENVFTQLSQTAAAEGRGKAFDAATDVAIEFSRTERPGRLLRARHAMYERRVYARLRDAFGGRCVYGISGGAPLGEQLSHFFRGAGMPILEGYGLTETTGASTVNAPEHHRVGTVGRPLPGTAARIEEDGELLLRGPHVMSGYWQAGTVVDATEHGGWFRTGDLAEIDAEGFVRITGRKKEIIVTAGGKNVAPGPLEENIRAHRLVSHCLVVGDGQPFVGALVTLEPDAYAEWARQHGKGALAHHTDDPELRAEIQQAVDTANASVSQAEAVRRFEILPVEWTEESGALTASRKLRRNNVVREFRREIRSLFE